MPVFSSCAVEALGEFLYPNGELLPVISSNGEYYFYNITTVSKCLDAQRCDSVFMKGFEASALDISKYVFFEDQVKDLAVFRVYQSPRDVFVNSEFVERAIEADLKGLKFLKVAPLQPNESYREIPPIVLE